jgi:hypothetical protein
VIVTWGAAFAGGALAANWSVTVLLVPPMR